jgi:transposase
MQKAKDGDYHQEMNGPTFLNWFENQLMPALKSPSVIVLDNASYHNIKVWQNYERFFLLINSLKLDIEYTLTGYE